MHSAIGWSKYRIGVEEVTRVGDASKEWEARLSSVVGSMSGSVIGGAVVGVVWVFAGSTIGGVGV